MRLDFILANIKSLCWNGTELITYLAANNEISLNDAIYYTDKLFKIIEILEP